MCIQRAGAHPQTHKLISKSHCAADVPRSHYHIIIRVRITSEDKRGKMEENNKTKRGN